MVSSALIIPVIAGAVAAGVMVAAWEQRRERMERRKFEATLTAVERQRWRTFRTSGGTWHKFADRLSAERKREGRRAQ
jgi:hypothetical protein